MVASIEPGQRVDRYVVERVLGEGGMAVVYRVRHETLGTAHALKVLTIGNKQIQARLVQEGRVQATLRHTNIVAVTDVLLHEGAPALLMEFIEGPSMDQLIQQYRPTLPESIALFRAVVAGVRHAHNKGLIHRDLKPANVMLDLTDGVTPKVTDFGLAKATEGDGGQSYQKTRAGTTMGTPAYMPPEQIRDASSVDKRADVYSLGAILFELVCGRPAFVADDIITLMTDVAAGKRADANLLAPGLPASVLATIERSMNPVAAERLADCDALLEMLDADPALPRSADLGLLASGTAVASAARGLGSNTPAPAQARSHPTWAGASGGPAAAEAPKQAPPADVARRPTPALTMVAPPPDAEVASQPPVNPSITSLSPMSTSMPPETASGSNRGVLAVAGVVVVLALAFAAVAGVGALAVALSAGGAGTTVAQVPPEPPVDVPPVVPPIDVKPVDVKPVDVPPVVAPVDVPPVVAPVDVKPVVIKPVVIKPVDVKPVDVKPVVVAAVATGTVTVAGDAQKVRLTDGTRELSPDQPIPVGTWQVKAWFDGPTPVSAGKVVVTAEKPMTIKCNASLLQCRSF